MSATNEKYVVSATIVRAVVEFVIPDPYPSCAPPPLQEVMNDVRDRIQMAGGRVLTRAETEHIKDAVRIVTAIPTT